MFKVSILVDQMTDDLLEEIEEIAQLFDHESMDSQEDEVSFSFLDEDKAREFFSRVRNYGKVDLSEKD